MREKVQVTAGAVRLVCDGCAAVLYEEVTIDGQHLGTRAAWSPVLLPHAHPNAHKDWCHSCLRAERYRDPSWEERPAGMLLAQIHDVEQCDLCGGAGCRAGAGCYHQGGKGKVYGADGTGLRIGNPVTDWKSTDHVGLILSRTQADRGLLCTRSWGLWRPARMYDGGDTAFRLGGGHECVVVMETSERTPHPTVFSMTASARLSQAEVADCYGADAARRMEGDVAEAFGVALRVPWEILQ